MQDMHFVKDVAVYGNERVANCSLQVKSIYVNSERACNAWKCGCGYNSN